MWRNVSHTQCAPLSYETVREWYLKSGQIYASGLYHKSPRPGGVWHLDEVFLKINGHLHYLWRAVDQDGDILDILVQRHRDRKAAKKFFRKLLKELQYAPRHYFTHFRVGRHLYSARCYREVLKLRFAAWEEVIHSESAP